MQVVKLVNMDGVLMFREQVLHQAIYRISIKAQLS
jgi:hypothetical protein